jgi:hypothetical protein
MTAIRGLLYDDAQPVALTAMNGRGDTIGITLLKEVVEKATTPDTRPERGDPIRVLPNPPDGGGDMRLYLTPDAVARDDAWRGVDERGCSHDAVYMNGRRDTLGVSVPVPGEWAGKAATLAPTTDATLDVFLPDTGPKQAYEGV